MLLLSLSAGIPISSLSDQPQHTGISDPPSDGLLQGARTQSHSKAAAAVVHMTTKTALAATPASSAGVMNRRSRGGCIDCKRSKIKCDEIRPFCGTCARRRHVCQGYATPPGQTSTSKARANSINTSRRPHLAAESSTTPASPGVDSKSSALALIDNQDVKLSPSDAVSSPYSVSISLKSFSLIPPGVVHPIDEPTVEIYFNRHPFELLIGPEFVDEMNSNVLVVLQRNPTVVVDSLSGIGHVYLSNARPDSIVPVLDRRARILANLRAMQASDYDLEEALVLLLGLCAMELVDPSGQTREATIPAVIANCASLISHHLSCGREISSLSKYFIRAIARQDMVVSMIQQRRPMIPTEVWLDEESLMSADRLMGYTTTLMPLLTELCGLAEDLRTCVPPTNLIEEAGSTTVDPSNLQFSHSPELELSLSYMDILGRAEDLRQRLQSWRPTIPPGLPFRSSRKFLSQASAYRAGALLYLHRILNPPGCSPESDWHALSKAHDILLHTTGPSDEVRMSLWPVFLASCEMESKDDRAAVLEVFESISAHRKTVTVQSTKAFCVDRVWKARDEGRDWNWMTLAQQYPEECLPI